MLPSRLLRRTRPTQGAPRGASTRAEQRVRREPTTRTIFTASLLPAFTTKRTKRSLAGTSSHNADADFVEHPISVDSEVAFSVLLLVSTVDEVLRAQVGVDDDVSRRVRTALMQRNCVRGGGCFQPNTMFLS